LLVAQLRPTSQGALKRPRTGAKHKTDQAAVG